MKIIECTQGSPEWLSARAGVLTASDFKTMRLRYKSGDRKGQLQDTALDLAFRKAIERISRVPLDENHVTWQMKRGHEMEPYARMCHEDLLSRRGGDLASSIVMQCGLMLTDDGVFGCSVDGLIGEHGGSEYKSLVSAGKLRKVILNRDISDYTDQIQGCLWISGRQWWHFGLYCPALKPIGMEFQMVEVERDEDHIEAMEADLIVFKRQVDDYEQELRDLGAQAVAEAAEEVRRMLAAPAGAEPVEEVF